jgi:AraC-like DNA-binding protein
MKLRDPGTSREAIRAALSAIVKRFTPIDGEHRVTVPALTFYRFSSLTKEDAAISKMQLIFAVQGAKTVTAGGVVYHYDTEHYLLTSIDMPVIGKVIDASPEKPYFGLSFEIDITQVAELVASRNLPPLDEESSMGLGIAEGELSLELLEATCRLARLLDTPKHIPVLAPLIGQEIIYRLLMSSQGARLRHALVTDSRAFKVAKAVEWIKAHYPVPMRIDALAAHVNMSVSSLHQHFKEATALSPLQYQKRLRLFEARRLLLKRASDVGLVAATVGYDNLSQFHREYKRLFGAPPIQDALRLRAGA